MPDFIDVVAEPLSVGYVTEVGQRGLRGPMGPSNEAGRSFLLDQDPTVSCVMVRSPPTGLLSSMRWTSTETNNMITLVTLTRVAGAVTSILTQVFDPGNGVTIIAQKIERFTRSPGAVPSTKTTREI